MVFVCCSGVHVCFHEQRIFWITQAGVETCPANVILNSMQLLVRIKSAQQDKTRKNTVLSTQITKYIHKDIEKGEDLVVSSAVHCLGEQDALGCKAPLMVCGFVSKVNETPEWAFFLERAFSFENKKCVLFWVADLGVKLGWKKNDASY